MTAQATLSEPTADLDQLKAAQQEAWSTGDFSLVARHTVFPGEVLLETLDLRAGQRVLDVATGSGNAALSAARRGAEVTGVDYVPELLYAGRHRAAAEQVSIDFREGDAEDLPFADETFDVVTSVFGAMFAPDHQRTADELLRVTRVGGKIGNANWTPESFPAGMFAVQSEFLPRPSGVTPASAWGTEQHIAELFGDQVEIVSATKRITYFRHRNVQEWLEFFLANLGPLRTVYDRMEGARRHDFAKRLASLAREHVQADDGTVVIPAEYLEIVLRKI